MISYVNKLGSVSVGNSNPVRIMGILNTSPESFYKKSISIGKKRIVDSVRRMEEDGADFVDTAASPREAAYESLRQVTKDEILAAFGVPESVIGNAAGRTFSNASEEGKVFWNETMNPHLELLSRGLDVLDEKFYVTFDTRSVPVLELAKQEKERHYLQEAQMGMITPNEYREITGRDKVDAFLADSMLASPQLAPIGNTEEPMPKEEAMPQGMPGMPMGMPPGGMPPEGMPPEGMPPEGVAVPAAEPVPEPDLGGEGLPPGAFPMPKGVEDFEFKRFDLNGEWETKAFQDIDRWEAIFKRSLERYFERQERVITEKVSGAKTKRSLSSKSSILTAGPEFWRSRWWNSLE